MGEVTLICLWIDKFVSKLCGNAGVLKGVYELMDSIAESDPFRDNSMECIEKI